MTWIEYKKKILSRSLSFLLALAMVFSLLPAPSAFADEGDEAPEPTETTQQAPATEEPPAAEQPQNQPEQPAAEQPQNQPEPPAAEQPQEPENNENTEPKEPVVIVIQDETLNNNGDDTEQNGTETAGQNTDDEQNTNTEAGSSDTENNGQQPGEETDGQNGDTDDTDPENTEDPENTDPENDEEGENAEEGENTEENAEENTEENNEEENADAGFQAPDGFTLVCDLEEGEEHTHTEGCYANLGADVEQMPDWERIAAQVELTGNWALDLVVMADSQVGYTASCWNYIIENGRKTRYTRYGAWAGDPYCDWCAAFVSFCIHFAGVEMPTSAGCIKFIEYLTDAGLYRAAKDHTPRPGDLVFFTRDNVTPCHVGIVAGVVDGVVWTIEGNHSNTVEYFSYDLTDPMILGYGLTPENPEHAPSADDVWPVLPFQIKADTTTTDPEDTETDPETTEATGSENSETDSEAAQEPENTETDPEPIVEQVNTENDQKPTQEPENTENNANDPEAQLPAAEPVIEPETGYVLIEQSLTDETGRVTVTGLLPVGATVTARALTEQEIEALALVGIRVLFAYDITIWVNGQEYQPTAPVLVQVIEEDLPETGLTVSHIETDENGEVSSTPVESQVIDGDAYFAADSFSIYIGFTVEYRHDEATFVTAGLSEVLLSEILTNVNYSLHTAAEATSVVFSDPSLIAVEPLADDWRLMSLAPFSTTETLEIAFSNGDTLSIMVTDTIEEHAITVECSLDVGTVTLHQNSAEGAQITSASSGMTVYVDVTAPEGYGVLSITYTPEGGSATDITSTKTFTMADVNVTVNVTFAKTIALTAGVGYQYYSDVACTSAITGSALWTGDSVYVKADEGYEIVTDSVIVTDTGAAAVNGPVDGVYTVSYVAAPADAVAVSASARFVMDLYYGNIRFTDTTVTYYDSPSTPQTHSRVTGEVYEITQSNNATPTTHTIWVGTPVSYPTNNTETTATVVGIETVIYLNGINIQVNTVTDIPIMVNNSADVYLVLVDGTTNTCRLESATVNQHAAVEKELWSATNDCSGALVITCEHGYANYRIDPTTGHDCENDGSCGHLNAYGNKAYAGVKNGSDGRQAEAQGGAGIGSVGSAIAPGVGLVGGSYSDATKRSLSITRSLKNLTIAGGVIIAKGTYGYGDATESGGAGIGLGAGPLAGYHSTGIQRTGPAIQNMVITGGYITAQAAVGGAANIGGTYRCNDVEINIYGGTIHADQRWQNGGMDKGASIGSGAGGTVSGSVSSAFINIYGGTIYAHGQYGAAIGGASGGQGSTKAYGDANTNYCEILIKGGTINAHSTNVGAAIGSGGLFGTGAYIGSTGDAKITIEGGTINASSTSGAAIGTGGLLATQSNNFAGNANVLIKGGSVSALDGGIGGGSAVGGVGGSATVTIDGGTVNASSIGGGNSQNNNGGDATVYINGGTTKITGGIGGGNSISTDTSVTKNGGTAIVNVTAGTLNVTGNIGGGYSANKGDGGGATINVNVANGKTASMTAGSVGGGEAKQSGTGGTANITITNANANDSAATLTISGKVGGGKSNSGTGGYASIDVSGGLLEIDSIGGGSSTSGAGGEADVTISGGTVHSTNAVTSIGGGNSTSGKGGDATVSVSGANTKLILLGGVGGGDSSTNVGGAATVTISGGETAMAGGIGGGDSSSADGGDASIKVTNGTLYCSSIGGGDSETGHPGTVYGTESQYSNAGVVITGGTVFTGYIGGGTNDRDDIGKATAYISGGSIQGQFILADTASTASDHCFVTMTGGTIDNTYLGNTQTVNGVSVKYERKQDNGGAIYMLDNNGAVSISGGTIQHATGVLGGAVYMSGGAFTLSGTGCIQNCEATLNGNEGGLGGAVYLGNGTVSVTGGSIGAAPTKEGGTTTTHGNSAVNGGGVYMAAGSMSVSGGSIGYNSATANGGGAYLNDGTLSMTGGSITDNTATGNGGGAYLNGGSLSMTGGSLGASGHGNSAVDGGGAYIQGGNFTLNGATASIAGNIAGQDGAGIYLTGGTPTLSQGSVSGNVAACNGGGLYINEQNVEISVASGQSFSLTNNRAGYSDLDNQVSEGTGSGAGMYIAGSGTAGSFKVLAANVGAVTITDNVAKTNGGGVDVYNGAFLIESNSGTVKINANEATDGGGVYVNGANGSVTIAGGTIGSSGAGNTASHDGAGVYLAQGELSLTGSTISYNTAGGNGGGAYLGDGTLTVDGGLVSRNKATKGGGVYLNGGTPNLSGGTVSYNVATQDGGGLYINQQDVTMSLALGRTFNLTNNRAGYTDLDTPGTTGSGAGMYISGNGTAGSFKVLDTNEGAVTITDNVAKTNGGGVDVANGSFTVENCPGDVAINNNSANDGGGVYVNGANGSVSVAAGAIGASGAGNTATQNGGGVYLAQGTFSASGGTIGYNTASRNGGGAYLGGGTFTASGAAISNNTATTGNGGGVYVGGTAESPGTLSVTSGSIDHNRAANGGGAYVAGGNVLMRAGSIDYNTATTGNGGGVAVADGNILMLGGTADHNTATNGNGGAMYVSSTSSAVDVTVRSGSLSYNRAVSGGAVAVESTHGTTVTIGLLEDHGIDYSKAKPYNTYNAFTYNETKETSSPIETHASCPVVMHNRASDDGGGFYLNSANSHLYFYCVDEDDNQAQGSEQCWSLDVEGGAVVIGDDQFPTGRVGDHPWGNIFMKDSILVTGGTVDVYGVMDNPYFEETSTVDITNPNDYYDDHRISTGGVQYKVHYFENFTGGGSTPKGLYFAEQYATNASNQCQITIYDAPAQFVHPGWKIKYWNLKANDTGKQYTVGRTYDLNNHDGDAYNMDSGGNTITVYPVPESDFAVLQSQVNTSLYNSEHSTEGNLLILYAIWERKAYTVYYDSNVEPGISITGSMNPQVIPLEVATKLNPNQFHRDGYIFDGWNTKADGTGDHYADKAEVTNLCTEDGQSITLYAEWIPCNHPTESLSYVSADGHSLIETCSCGNHTATATLSALDGIYDRTDHPATLTITGEWLGQDTAHTQPTISYQWKDYKVTDYYTVVNNDYITAPDLVNAGDYKASISITKGTDTKTATVDYRVAKAEQPEPTERLSIAASSSSNSGGQVDTLTLYADGNDQNIPKSSITGAEAHYLCTTVNPLTGNETWSDSRTKTGLSSNTYYYFYGRYKETMNYLCSRVDYAGVYLTPNGAVTFILDTGITVTPGEEEGSGSQFSVGVATGYHWDHYFISGTIKPAGGSSETLTLTESSSGSKNYSFTMQTSDEVVITITGAARDPVASAKVIGGEVFSDFNGVTNPPVSSDSAFTVQFNVSGIKEQTSMTPVVYDYSSPALSFSQDLPAGTTIIMKVDSTYYKYAQSGDLAADSPIYLTSFTQMGVSPSTSFSYTPSDAFSAQFIVNTHKNGTLPPGALTAKLAYTARTPGADEATELPDLYAEGTVTVVAPPTFSLSAGNVNGLSIPLTVTYNRSLGTASFWSNRQMALVVEADNGSPALPADAKLRVTYGSTSTDYTRNAEGKFIIPLGAYANYAPTITLVSSLFPAAPTNYGLTANLYVSNSLAKSAPLNGCSPASVSFTLSSLGVSAPAVKVTTTSQIINQGSVFKPMIEVKNTVPYKIMARIYKKDDNGVYQTTGYNELLKEANSSSELKTIDPSMSDVGSYKLVIEVIDTSNAPVLTVPYYFLVVEN